MYKKTHLFLCLLFFLSFSMSCGLLDKDSKPDNKEETKIKLPEEDPEEDKKDEANENKPKIFMTWHSGAMNALIPINALLTTSITKLKRKNIIHYGTSSGAIVASLFSMGYTTTDIKKFFEDNAESAFGLRQILASVLEKKKGAGTVLKRKLHEILDSKKLSDFPNLHVLVAEDDKVVELSLEAGFGDLLVADAVMASVSIPKVFGPYDLDGHKYFDAGAIHGGEGPMNDPSDYARAKKGPDDLLFSMANGFQPPKSYPDDANFILLIGPTPDEMKARMDNIPINVSGALGPIGTFMAKRIGIKNLSSLTANDLFHPKAEAELAKNNLDRPNFYSAMTNAEAIKAFEDLGKTMANNNLSALQKLEGLVAK